MTYQEFRKAANDDPTVVRRVFDYHVSNGTYNGNLERFEQQTGNLEHLFRTYYAQNQGPADRMGIRGNRARNRQRNRANRSVEDGGTGESVMSNGYFRRSLFGFGTGIAIAALRQYSIEYDVDVFDQIPNFVAPMIMGIGLIGMAASGISNFLNRR